MSDDMISKALGLPTLKSLLDGKSDIPDAELVEEDESSEIEDEDDIVEEDNTLSAQEIIPPATDIQSVAGVVPYVESTERNKVAVDHEYLKDIEKAKNNISKLISDGNVAFGELVIVATQTGNPSAFDAASRLIKSLVDANERMVGMSEKKKAAKNLTNQGDNVVNNTTTNNTLILTSAELLKQFKKD